MATPEVLVTVQGGAPAENPETNEPVEIITASPVPEITAQASALPMDAETTAAVQEEVQQDTTAVELQASVEATAAPVQETEKDAGGVSLLVIVAVAVVILIAALAVVLRMVRRRREEQELESMMKPSTRIPLRGRNAGDMSASPRTETVEETDLPRGSRYRVGYAQIMGSRENQEDSYCISNWMDPQVLAERGLLAAVADGIGGMSNGQVASGTVLRNMCARFDRQDGQMSLSDRLLELAAQGQQDVLRIVQKSGPCGTTLVSVLIKDGYMVMLSVGDSRISLYRSGMLLQLNREHVLGKETDESSMLNFTAQNTDARKRKAITAYLGKPNLRLIDRTTTPMKLVSGDRILLMSDGVFGPLSDDEIISAMRLPPDQAAQAIVQAVEDKKLPHQDNATIVIVEME